MPYEINVSLNDQHFFATHERSARYEDKMKELYSAFKEKFPKSEGYEISVTEYRTMGTIINMEGGEE